MGTAQRKMVPREHGAYALMHKPFALHEMLGNVQAALREAA